MDSKIINCPDIGDVEIKEFTSVGQLDRFYNSGKNNPSIATDSLISSVLIGENNSENFTDNDKVSILIAIATELEIEEYFKKQISEGGNYYDAFYSAFETSDYYKSLKKSYSSFESLIAPSLAITKMNQAYFRNYSSLSSIHEAAKAISKQINPGLYNLAKVAQPQDSIQRSILAYQKAMKGIQFPLSNELSINKIIQQQQLIEQTKSFNDLFKLSSLNLERLRNLSAHNKNLFEPITILSKRYTEINTIFGITDNALINISRNLDYIRSAPNIDWINQLNVTAKLINNCNTAINSTNEYFVDSKAIGSIVNESVGLESSDVENITGSVVESESIIQDKAGSSVIIQGEFAQVLFEKIDSIREDTNKYKRVFDHFEQFLNPQSFSDFLDEFALIVSREYWQQFWSDIGNTFKPSPESIAKSNLGLFLTGRFTNTAFIGQELMAGNGFIDLLINFFGYNYLVELKVIGSTKPISWAKSGISQLNDYMGRFNLDKGYLVVYDGRKTDRGEQLEDYYDVENGQIIVKKIKIYYQE